MQRIGESLVVLVTGLLLVCLGIAIGKERAKNGSTIIEKERVDTLVILDTIRVSEPIFFTRKVVDTMLVAVTDTIVRNDTTFVYLPKEQKLYMSPYYDAWVSGYNPHLDSIKLYQKTKIVTKEIPVVQKTKPHWSVGLQGGYGIGKDGLTPYVGVGIQYNILSF